MNFKLNPVSKKRLATASTLAVVAGMAMALNPSAASAQDDTAEEEEAIVVTGSRIPRPEFELSNPVASADAVTIQQSGATNLTDFAQDMPALLNSFDLEAASDTGFGGGLQGLNLLDLRGLGTARTLVLVDGRRHVAGQEGFAAVDVNTIPIDLVERIEVLTGGASAVYGADGVTGVVNFVMRDDYEGLQARAQTNWTDQGGGGSDFASLIWGRNFADGRANVTLAGEYSRTAALDFNDRDYIASGNAESILDDPDYGSPGHPYQRAPTRDARYIDTSPGGSFMADCDGDYGVFFGCNVVDPGSLTGMDFTGDGLPWVDGAYLGGAFMRGGSGSRLEDFNDQLIADLDRWTINARGHFDFNNNHRVVGELKWAHTETYFVGQPTYDFGTLMAIDNPYMPASIVTASLVPNGLGTYYGGVFMFRDNFDLGTLDQAVERDTYRVVLALEGAVTDSIDYDISWVWGQTTSDQAYRTRNNERWFAAIDVVDGPSGPECRDNSGGETWDAGTCVPANVFGDGNISQEAIDFIMTSIVSQDEISQAVLSGYLAGDTSGLGISFPGGPVSFAVGAEYREEESEFNYDDFVETTSSPADLFWNGGGADSFGRYDVAEAFLEVELPILRDLPLAQEFTVDAAYRISDYSTVGGTDASKIGARYRPTDWIMFRGTIATAVRAPSITELFSPIQVTAGSTGPLDPCDSDNVNSGSAIREANCIATFAALGVPYDPNTWENTTSTTISGLAGGNQNLRPETADTTTYGFVFEPTFLPGLSIAVDYWEIEVKDAIQLLDLELISNYCYDFAQPNQYCALIERTATGVPSLAIPPGGVSDFTTTYLNVASFQTSGYDISARYRLDPADLGIGADIGTFQFVVNATRLETWSFRDSDLSPPIDDLGEPGQPEWQAVFDATWRLGNLTVNYGYSWFSETERFSKEALEADPDLVAPEFRNWSERSVHDLFVAYDFNDRYRLYGGVTNFTDQRPDRASVRGPYPVDEIGRAFFVGARANF